MNAARMSNSHGNAREMVSTTHRFIERETTLPTKATAIAVTADLGEPSLV